MNLRNVSKKTMITGVLALAAFIIAPFFMTTPYLRLLLNRIVVSVIVVLGLNFITGIVGQLNMGTAGILAIGAYTYGLLVTKANWSPWLATLASIFAGLIVGLILGYPSLKIRGVYLVLATMSFGETVRILLLNMVDFSGGQAGLPNITRYVFNGESLGKNSNGFYFILLISMLIIVMISYRVIHSKWGRVFKATRDSQDAVETCGVSTAGVKVRAFLLCAIFTSFAGALYAGTLGFITPTDFSSDMSTRFIMMLMVGGVGKISGCIVGAILVTILPEALRFIGDAYWFIFSGVVLLSAIFLPHGCISLPGRIYSYCKDKVLRKGA